MLWTLVVPELMTPTVPLLTNNVLLVPTLNRPNVVLQTLPRGPCSPIKLEMSPLLSRRRTLYRLLVMRNRSDL